VPLVLAEKHVREHNRAFTTLARGEVVRIDRLSPRGDGLRLDDESAVDRIAAADAPLPPRKPQ
jgi:hypothetical protein